MVTVLQPFELWWWKEAHLKAPSHIYFFRSVWFTIIKVIPRTASELSRVQKGVGTQVKNLDCIQNSEIKTMVLRRTCLMYFGGHLRALELNYVHFCCFLTKNLSNNFEYKGHNFAPFFRIQNSKIWTLFELWPFFESFKNSNNIATFRVKIQTSIFGQKIAKVGHSGLLLGKGWHNDDVRWCMQLAWQRQKLTLINAITLQACTITLEMAMRNTQGPTNPVSI